MNNSNDFKKYTREIIDWICDYYENIRKYPVKSQVHPREIYNKLPENPSDNPENMEKIFKDFEDIILPGITHWQSPNFYAYFPANSSIPSLLAEILTSALGAQCMKWETSPAAAELEEKVMNWLKKMTELPDFFEGVIQDTASTSTLVAILTAREKLTEYKINENGFSSNNFRVYCSSEAHSSVEKAVKIAGIGRNNLVKIQVDSEFKLISSDLRNKIREDLNCGNKPLCVVATIGTTGSTAIDPLDEIAEICSEFNIWLHTDAAFAGSALILPEYRWMIKGIEKVDSFVFNPHKWLFTNFDCSAYFIKDKTALIKTFEILPEYLKTISDSVVNNYCDWGIQLGRRFRALKLWFVIRNFGIKGLQEKIREHISLAKILEKKLLDDGRFEILAPVNLNLICFRYNPDKTRDDDLLNKINEKLLHKINQTGKIFLSHTKLNGKYVLRMVTGQTNLTKEHIIKAWELIKQISRTISVQL